MDLRVAQNCIKVMKEYRTYNREKIGIVSRGFSGEVDGYVNGELVLFKEELKPSDSELHMGEYCGMEQKLTGRVTVESPLCQADIDKQKAKGSLITTIRTIVGVPSDKVEEIVMQA